MVYRLETHGQGSPFGGQSTGPQGGVQATASPRRVAIVGSGITGLGAAWRLRAQAPATHISLYEADDRLGGHANTIDVTLADSRGHDVTHGVDTGFLVYNERTYPRLIAFFAELGVSIAPSNMSFSVQARDFMGSADTLTWSGNDLNGVFAQRSNALSWSFLSMLVQTLRFNRLATRLALQGSDAQMQESLGSFLNRHRFGRSFKEGYLLPMIACIWSCPMEQMLAFPVATLIRFCHNHGLLQVMNRPQWFTVNGGSKHYVQKAAASVDATHLSTPVTSVVRDNQGVLIRSKLGVKRYDAVIMACHAPQALALLGADATPDERAVLSNFRTQRNVAVLHTDKSVMPQERHAWAAWNYERGQGLGDDPSTVCLHYWINRLQPLPFASDVFVSLNPLRAPAAAKVLGQFDYAHPIFDQAAIAAQPKVAGIQGSRRTWFAGAWSGYGFHEDGLRAGQEAASSVAAAIGAAVFASATNDVQLEGQAA
jgi:uncharacterized protein